jgi:hypothetical protein
VIEGLNDVVGSVTMNGKPVNGGLVVNFIQIGEDAPKGGERGFGPPIAGNGIVQADGAFKVYQSRGPAGLKAGRYAVTFSPYLGSIVDNAKKDNPVPEKYRAVNTTPYRIEVKADVRNRFEFKIEKE